MHWKVVMMILAGAVLTSFGWVVEVRAAAVDCNIFWNEILHDSFNPDYREPPGAVPIGTTSIRLRLRVAQSDINSAWVRVYRASTGQVSSYEMFWDGAFDQDPVTYDWWVAAIPVGSERDVIYYAFELNDDGEGECPPEHPDPDQDYYQDDDQKFYGGGTGAVYNSFTANKDYQITIYQADFQVPEWLQRGVIYQIFPDRFRDGNPANNPVQGAYYPFGPGQILYRSGQTEWNYPICDSRGIGMPSCYGNKDNNFYGGDLAGITEKINQGYFDNLGVTILYLNPIFFGPENHAYGASDYFLINPAFGTDDDFDDLIAAAHAHGLKIILDGVFNHCSTDSCYFDLYNRFDVDCVLTSPLGPGNNDGSGACEASTSPYAPWFYFDSSYSCTGCWSKYIGWADYCSLPIFAVENQGVRDFFYALGGLDSVATYWLLRGADGWRLDVGAEIDNGFGNRYPLYWEEFRPAVHAVQSDAVIIGEHWGDSSYLLRGQEWDGTMNYRIRSALLSWLFTGCSGQGCTNGTVFEDCNSYPDSDHGAISELSPSDFNKRLQCIWEDYPPPATKGLMNLVGSHDTNRIRFLLYKTSGDDDIDAVQRMKEMWLFLFTYPGAPTVYYGDEVGLCQYGIFDERWQGDPYNRAPYPWPDTPGYFIPNTTELLPHYRKMASIYHAYRVLQDGDVHHGLIVDDQAKVYGYGRTNGSQIALIALNRDIAHHTAAFTGLNAPPFNLPDGTEMFDVIEGNSYSVTDGAISLQVNLLWGAVLVESSKLDTPAPCVQPTTCFNEEGLLIEWPSVTLDTNGERELIIKYELHAGSNPDFAPSAETFVAEVEPPAFGSELGMIQFVHEDPVGSKPFYKVLAYNAGGKYSCSVGSKHGDVDYTGNITAGDAQKAFTIALGIYPPCENPCCVDYHAADCNGDAQISAGDAQAIFNAAIGLGSCVDQVPDASEDVDK